MNTYTLFAVLMILLEACALVPQAGTTGVPQDPREQYAQLVSRFKPGDPVACNMPAIPAPRDLEQTVRVFFASAANNNLQLGAIPARVVAVQPGQDPKRAALAALFAGPTAAEVQAGYYAIYGADTQNIPFKLETLSNGLVIITLDSAIRRIVRQTADSRIGIFVVDADSIQIYTALAQFPDVQRVAIFIGDQPLCELQQGC